MPNIPNYGTLSASAVDILNAIRNGASSNYRDYVPYADNSLNSIKEIGAVIMNYSALQNEFLSALVNRIGRVIITSKMYSNPWSVFKKGMLEYGETIEEIFVNIAKPFQYNVERAEEKVFAREIPDVRAGFHTLNYQKFYKATIQNEQLNQAFLSWNGIVDLIARIVDSMYAGASYDEFLAMKYLLSKNILNGRLMPVQVPTVNSDNMKMVASTIKGISNKFTFMTTEYNIAGVANYSAKPDQYLIVNAEFDATMDVEVLASAFNMDKAEFSGHRILIDGFGKLDIQRLDYLFNGTPNYTTPTTEELEALSAIPAVLVDRDWFMIFDNMQKFTENYNGEGLYWNYWLHQWKTLSVSPFANAVVFVPGIPTIESISISPDTASVTAGQSILLTANVTTDNFASKAVNWSVIPESEGIEITRFGTLNIGANVESGTEITVTATSAFDSTKSANALITVV